MIIVKEESNDNLVKSQSTCSFVRLVIIIVYQRIISNLEKPKTLHFALCCKPKSGRKHDGWKITFRIHFNVLLFPLVTVNFVSGLF